MLSPDGCGAVECIDVSSRPPLSCRPAHAAQTDTPPQEGGRGRVGLFQGSRSCDFPPGRPNGRGAAVLSDIFQPPSLCIASHHRETVVIFFCDNDFRIVSL